MFLPRARGPLSAALLCALRRDDPALLPAPGSATAPDPLADDDWQLALWVCQELHYQGFSAISEDWEWQPDLLRLRRALEAGTLEALRAQVPQTPSGGTVAERLQRLVELDDSPPLSSYLQRHATALQFAEFLVHRSIYQLKEADPHTWAIPRLSGRAKAALVEIQFDEYGGGRPVRMHSELYRKVLRRAGLSDEYGHYVDVVPGITLAISTVMSTFGLTRSLRGAAVGHLAAYEMTSSIPCRRYGIGLRRLGADDDACDFFDEHITADAAHEQMAQHDLCGALAKDEPGLAESILFGAAACLYVEGRLARHVLGAWQDGCSSLRGSWSAPGDQALRASLAG